MKIEVKEVSYLPLNFGLGVPITGLVLLSNGLEPAANKHIALDKDNVGGHLQISMVIWILRELFSSKHTMDAFLTK